MNLDIRSYNRMQTLFSSVAAVSQDKGEKYISITNLDGKTWRLPVKHMTTAMNLYQPSAMKGKILKKFLPLINYIPGLGKIAQKLLRITEFKLSIQPILLNKLKNVFKCAPDEIELSYFLGTPSVHQKITVQVSTKSSILGYCKITDSKEIMEIFKHEEDILKTFQASGIENIPVCLYCGSLSDSVSEIKACSGVNLFIQSTTKTNKSRVEHNITKLHYNFLSNLAMRTKTNVDYLSSDYHTMIEGLKENLHYLDVVNELVCYASQDKSISEMAASTKQKENFSEELMRNTVLKVIDLVEKSLSKDGMVFSGYHGDFTPWNMFFEEDRLFVFDFEYAKKSYPPMIDIFHYFTQSCIFEKKLDADDIYYEFISKFDNKDKMGGVKVGDLKLTYCYYLLDIIALYLNRDKGNFNRNVERNLIVCVQLLYKLMG